MEKQSKPLRYLLKECTMKSLLLKGIISIPIPMNSEKMRQEIDEMTEKVAKKIVRICTAVSMVAFIIGLLIGTYF